MVALGVLLVALAVLASVVVSAQATDVVRLDILGWDVTTDGTATFWIGAASMLVAVVGALLVVRGMKRSLRLRKDARQLRKEQKRQEKEAARQPQPFAGTADGELADPPEPPPVEPAYDDVATAPGEAEVTDPYETRYDGPDAPGPSADPGDGLPGDPRHDPSSAGT